EPGSPPALAKRGSPPGRLGALVSLVPEGKRGRGDSGIVHGLRIRRPFLFPRQKRVPQFLSSGGRLGGKRPPADPGPEAFPFRRDGLSAVDRRCPGNGSRLQRKKMARGSSLSRGDLSHASFLALLV